VDYEVGDLNYVTSQGWYCTYAHQYGVPENAYTDLSALMLNWTADGSKTTIMDIDWRY